MPVSRASTAPAAWHHSFADGLELARPLALGPVLVGKQRLTPRVCAQRRGGEDRRSGAVAFHFLLDGAIDWLAPAPRIACRSGDVLVLDVDRSWSFSVETPVRSVALLAPRAFLDTVLAGRMKSGPLSRSAALDAVAYFLQAVLAIEPEALSDSVGEKLAFALRELLAAAAAPTAVVTELLAQRRDATLLDRVTVHIDAHLGDALDTAALCEALGCSRSTLYRAAAPAGGVAELIARRRLAAIHGRLRAPGERRTIAQLASDHGFTDPVQFSRRFKRAFGTTAGQVRTQGDARRVTGEGLVGEAGEPAFDPLRPPIDVFAPL